MTLAEAIQEWGKLESKARLRTWEHGIEVWYEEGAIYDSYASLSSYHALHSQIPITTSILGVPHQESMDSQRLEVLLSQLAEVYPDLWSRDDWDCFSRYN